MKEICWNDEIQKLTIKCSSVRVISDLELYRYAVKEKPWLEGERVDKRKTRNSKQTILFLKFLFYVYKCKGARVVWGGESLLSAELFSWNVGKQIIKPLPSSRLHSPQRSVTGPVPTAWGTLCCFLTIMMGKLFCFALLARLSFVNSVWTSNAELLITALKRPVNLLPRSIVRGLLV